MRIAHVTPWGIRCGVARHLSYWLALANGDNEHLILASNPPHWYGNPEDWLDIPCIRCWERAQDDALTNVWREAQTFGADVIHLQYDAQFWHWTAIGPFLEQAHRAGVPVVATAHVLHDLTENFTRANCALLESVDLLVVGTPAMREAFENYAKQFHFSMRRPVLEIPLAVPTPPTGTVAKEALGPTVVSFGFLGGHKGHDGVIEGVRQMRSRGYPDARYIVAGDAFTGEQRQTLEALRAHEKATPGMVIARAGFMTEDEIYRLCQGADLVVFNHRLNYRSSSGTVLFGITSGTPVVVADVPMLTSGFDGVVWPVGDGPEDWSTAMVRALGAGDVRAEVQAAAAKRLAAPVVAAQYEAVYRKLKEGEVVAPAKTEPGAKLSKAQLAAALFEMATENLADQDRLAKLLAAAGLLLNEVEG